MQNGNWQIASGVFYYKCDLFQPLLKLIELKLFLENPLASKYSPKGYRPVCWLQSTNSIYHTLSLLFCLPFVDVFSIFTISSAWDPSWESQSPCQRCCIPVLSRTYSWRGLDCCWFSCKKQNGLLILCVADLNCILKTLAFVLFLILQSGGL